MVAAALLLSVPSGAVPVDVTFSIDASFLSTQTGSTVLAGPGTLKVRFASGTAAGAVSAGALHVVSGSLNLTNNFTVDTGPLGILSFTGSQRVTFPGSGVGSFTAGGGFNLATVGLIASGFIHCDGILCSGQGFPPSLNAPLTGGPRTLNFGGLLAGFPGLALLATGTGGPTLLVTLTGQEVSRSVVPEPGTGLLVGLGLAGLAAGGGAFGARRRH